MAPCLTSISLKIKIRKKRNSLNALESQLMYIIVTRHVPNIYFDRMPFSVWEFLLHLFHHQFMMDVCRIQYLYTPRHCENKSNCHPIENQTKILHTKTNGKDLDVANKCTHIGVHAALHRAYGIWEFTFCMWSNEKDTAIPYAFIIPSYICIRVFLFACHVWQQWWWWCSQAHWYQYYPLLTFTAPFEHWKHGNGAMLRKIHRRLNWFKCH